MAYNGKNFSGYQIQNSRRSVQGDIENALSTLFSCKIPIVGVGRTDTAVSASQYFAHFDIEDEQIEKIKSPFEAELKYKLNAILASDIAIYKIYEVSPELHARFSAKERTYRYYFHRYKQPFIGESSLYIRQDIDIEKMREAARYLVGKKDFSAFEKAHASPSSHICNLISAKIEEIEEGRYYFEFTANRFLRNMVRAMVGTLLEIGRGRKDIGYIEEVLSSKNRNLAGESVPAHALYLTKICY